jgi:hypothetical protein
MADLKECVEAEEENIRHALGQLPPVDRLSSLSELELAGTAAMLQSIYNGIENVLKQTLLGSGCDIPMGATWHRDLLRQAETNHILNPETAEALRPFMAFRHFFSHSYALDLDPARMELLVSEAASVVDRILNEVLVYINSRAIRNGPATN